MTKQNTIHSIPLNPNVTLDENDEIQRQLFRADDILSETVKSKKFQDLLLTDPTTQEGRDLIAEHFDITDKWNKNYKSGTKKGLISDSASAYYYLLMTVKCESKNDFIWMSFYEGLHRHAALLLSLTSSAFNLTKNEIKFKSLTTDYFLQQRLENFKSDIKQPHEQLTDVFDGKVKAKMLSEIFNIKAIIPRKLEETLKKMQLQILQIKSQSTVNSSATANKRLQNTAYQLF